jgi:site-specific DNA-adenine methylase
MSYPINYAGNKYKETKKYFIDKLDTSKYKYIAEPFGGIFGFSRAVGEVDKNIKFLVNDIDGDLITAHKLFKTAKSYTIQKCIKKRLNEIKTDDDTDCSLKQKLIKLEDDDVYSRMLRIIAKSSFYVNFVTKLRQKIDNIPSGLKAIRDILDRCSFFNLDYMDFVKKVNDNYKDVLFYFDPPYFDSKNFAYIAVNNKNKEVVDNSKIYIDMMQIFNTGVKFMAVLNDLVIFRHLFKDHKYFHYSKTYQFTNKKAQHICYHNIKFKTH